MQVAAAAKAGVSERTARRIDQGVAGGASTARRWRTRANPFDAVWAEVVNYEDYH